MGAIVDHRTTPAGVVPPHLQQWILIGIVVVMVGILTFTGPSAKPRVTGTGGSTGPAAALAAMDANQQRIEEYQKRLKEQEGAGLGAGVQGATVPGAVLGAGLQGAVPDAGVPGAVADNVAFSRPGPGAAAAKEPTTGVPAGSSSQETRALQEPRGSQETRYRLFEGTFIETVLTNRLDGTFPGPVNCLVTTTVYASDLQHVLIPAGSRALGEARAVNAFGQSRLAVVFHRLVLPNSSRVDLNSFHGLNQIGDLGLNDQVDRHYAQIFGASLAVGAIAGLAQARTGGGIDATAIDAYRQGAAANLAQSSARILERFLNILPTVTIREGHRIKVYLANDLELPEYHEKGAGVLGATVPGAGGGKR